LVIAARIECERRAAKSLDLVDLALMGAQIPVVISADCSYADFLAGKRQLLGVGVARAARGRT
jgi:hypothetical protein